MNNNAKTKFTFVLMLIILFTVASIEGNLENTYTMDAEIVAISDEVISVKDSMNEVWEFYGDGFRIGDNVKVRFFTNGTDDTRYDDVIKSVKNF